jgi:uncharacterized protein YjdB
MEKVIKSDKFKALVNGKVPTETRASGTFVHYYGSSTITRGWSCAGFANYALWYIFASKNSDEVKTQNITPVKIAFNYKNMSEKARPGDIIRIKNSSESSAHSAIVYSINQSSVTVIDCNSKVTTGGNCLIRKYNIPYGDYFVYVGIGRATNYADYSVSYNANGGEGAPAAQAKAQNVTLTLSSVNPRRDQFNFAGWCTKQDGTGQYYAAGATYTANASTTLYAIWEAVPVAPTPTVTPNPATLTVSYQTHVQDIGWQGYVSNGAASGTSGQSKRLEAINIKLDLQGITGGIEYRTHVQDIGWQDWVANDALSGTSGQSKRLEAIQIRLTGEVANAYDVYYRVHAQNVGWMDWAKNGESSGTAGYSYRLEAIEIKLVAKGGAAPGATTWRFIDKYEPVNAINYRTHVQDIGWQPYVSNGMTSGTSGQSKRLEGIQIKLNNIEGGIEYRTHVQDIGWMDWVADDAMSGTSAQSKRLEAIQIRLTGAAAEAYDLYYCVHAQNTGWLDWAKNGESSGTSGFGYRLEAIQIVLVPKGGPAPGATARPFVQG